MATFNTSGILSYSTSPDTTFRLMKGERSHYSLSYPRVTSKDLQGAVYMQHPVMGVELEVEVLESAPNSIVKKVYDSLVLPEGLSSNHHRSGAPVENTFAILKSDATIRNGFEVVSSPASLNFHKSGVWEDFFEVLAKKHFKKSAPNAGMHIHINKWSFKSIDIAKFITFMNLPDNRDFVAAVGERNGNTGYCNWDSAHAKVTSTNGKKVDQSGSRTVTVNLGHRSKNTAEVRIFGTTANEATFFKNLEFVHNLRLFVMESSIQRLNYKYFLDWLHTNPNNNNQHLRVFLENKEFKPNNGKSLIKPSMKDKIIFS